MNETLGKRIARYRKQLGLTQDALAEKLGITAQAVSKWENDQSCPDIATLPKLSEIFGISIDELLGQEPPQQVHEAEVVEAEETRSGIHFENDEGQGWEFHWDSGRAHAFRFAFCVLFVGILTLLSRLLNWDVSFWSILWPSFILFTGLNFNKKRVSMFDLACILFGGYFLVSNLGVWYIQLASELIFPICVVLFGLSLLIDALRKPKKTKFRITKRGKNSEKTKARGENGPKHFSCDVSFGELTHRVSVPYLERGEADVSFGTLIVDLSDVESVAPGCKINADCSFGELRLLVPARFRVECESDTTFGDVHIHGHPAEDADGIISLNADASFGSIAVHYI